MRPLFLALAFVAQTAAAASNFPPAIFPEQPVSAPVFTSPAGNQQTLAVASDGNIGFAVWLDQRSGHTDLYGSRIDANGVSLDPTGILIATGATGGTVIWNGSEFVVVSQRGSNDTFAFVTTEGAIVSRKTMTLLYMQIGATMGSGPDARILFIGIGRATIVDSKANIVMADIQLSAVPQPLIIAGAGENEFLILHLNLDAGSGSRLFADRLDRDGRLLGTVDSGVDFNIIGSTLALAGGSDGYLLVGRGAYEREVLAAHLDHNGVLTTLRTFAAYDVWMRVLTVPKAKPALLRDGDHYEVTWTISDENGDAHTWRVTEPAAGPQGTPTRIFDWTGSGYGTTIAKIASQPVIITDALRSGVSTSIDPVVTASGPAHPVLSSSATLQSLLQVATSGNGYAVIWNEFGPDGSTHLYLRRFQAASSAEPVEVASNATGRAVKARIAASGDVYVIAWSMSDTTYESANYVVRRMSATTGEWLDDEAVPLAAAYELVFGSSNGGVLAAYTIGCSSRRCLRTRPISTDAGAAILFPEAIPTSSAAYELSIASNGHDYLIAWNENVCIFPCDVPFPSRVLAVRVGNDGRALDSKPIVIDDIDSFSHYPSIAWTGSSYAVVWHAGSQTSGRHVSASGVVDAIRKVSAPHSAHLIVAGNRLLLIYTEQNGDAVTTSGLAVDSQSLTATGDPMLLVANQPTSPTVSAATLSNGVVLAYDRIDPTSGNATRVFTRIYGEAVRRRAAR
jgi:hypothetical protein